eukprot:scaffold19800_cov58-Cyclotella_meneghiniana.AAC.1
MRPIVACCYSFMNDCSNVKDSQQVLDELKALVLPPNARDLPHWADSKFSGQEANLNPASRHRPSLETHEELFPASWVSRRSASGSICGCK